MSRMTFRPLSTPAWSEASAISRITHYGRSARLNSAGSRCQITHYLALIISATLPRKLIAVTAKASAQTAPST